MHKEEALLPSWCDHAGPVLIEPEDEDGEGTYRANCLICLSFGPARATHAEALEGLLERSRVQFQNK